MCELSKNQRDKPFLASPRVVNFETFFCRLKLNLTGKDFVTWVCFKTPEYVCFGFQFKELVWNIIIEPHRDKENGVGKGKYCLRNILYLLESKGCCLVGYESAKTEIEYILSLRGDLPDLPVCDLPGVDSNKEPKPIVIPIQMILKDLLMFGKLFNENHSSDHYFLSAYFNVPYMDPPSIQKKLSNNVKDNRIKPRFLENQKCLFEMARFTNEWIQTRTHFAQLLDVPLQDVLSHPSSKLVDDFLSLKSESKVVYGRAGRGGHCTEKLQSIERWRKSQILDKNANLYGIYANHFDTKPAEAPVFRIEPFGLKIRGGFGGLHSLNSGGFAVESTSDTSVLEIDFSSYYPTLVKNLVSHKGFERVHFPGGLYAPRLGGIMEEFTRTRIQLKNENNPIHQTYKLILNRIFGLTNARFSGLYLPHLNWSVTLNGQILLAQLIYVVKDLLIDLVWVNTDGFICTIQNKNIPEMDKRISDFGARYAFSIGNAVSLRFCAIANVNTLLRQFMNGDVKLKGVPGPFHNGSTCVQNVLINLVKSHDYKELRELGREELWRLLEVEMGKQAPKDFIMHSRANNLLIRYIYAINPDFWDGFTPDCEIDSTDDGDVKKNKTIARGKAISLVRSSFDSDENICKFEYIKEVYEQLKAFGIINDNPKEPFPNNWAGGGVSPKHTRACVSLARVFAEKGLFVLPGSGKSLPKGIKVEKLAEDPKEHLVTSLAKHSHVWIETANTLSAICKKESGWICFDIDDEGIMKYKHARLFDYMQENRKTSLCVVGSRGSKFIFRVPQNSDLWSMRPSVKENGFEIIARACFAGAYISGYNSGDPNTSYRYSWNEKYWAIPLDIPSDLFRSHGCFISENYLTMPAQKGPKGPYGGPPQGGWKILKEHLPKVIDWLESTHNFLFQRKEEGSEAVYTSPCLYKDTHDPTKVLLSLNEESGEFKLICAHEGCREKYIPFFIEALGLLRQLAFRFEEDYLFQQAPDFESVYNASTASDEPILLKSPTGAGKTKSAKDRALHMVLENPDVIPVLAFPSKRLAKDVMNRIEEMIEEKQKFDARAANVHVQLISYETNMTLEKLYVLFQVDPRPKIILTVHSYFRQRGHSRQLTLLAGFLLYNAHRVWLFVDEIHRFIGDSLVKFPYVRVKAHRQSKTRGVDHRFPVRTCRELLKRNVCIDDDLEPGVINAELNSSFDAWQLSDKLSFNPGKYTLKINTDKAPTRLNMTSQIREVLPDSNSETATICYLDSQYEQFKKLFKILEQDGGMNEKRDSLQKRWIFLNSKSSAPSRFLELLEALDSIEDSLRVFIKNPFIKNPKSELRDYLNVLTGAPELQINQWISHFINTSFKPCLIEYFPYNLTEGAKFSLPEFAEWAASKNRDPKDISAGFDEDEDFSEVQETSKGISKIALPKQAPFSSDLICQSLLPTMLAARMKTSVFASASYEKHHLDYLRVAIGKNFLPYTVPRPSNRKLQHIHIFISRSDWFNFPRNLDFWPPLLKKFHYECIDWKVLNFSPNDAATRRSYDAMSSKSPYIGYIDGSRELTAGTFMLEFVQNPKSGPEYMKNHIANALGLIGTGVNLPERKLIFLQTSPYRPYSAFWYAENSDEAQQHMLQDLVTTCIQNMGRFMRFTPAEEHEGKEARRVVFIMNPKNTPGLVPMLLALVKENFETVGVTDMGEMEEKLSNANRKRARKAQAAEINYQMGVLRSLGPWGTKGEDLQGVERSHGPNNPRLEAGPKKIMTVDQFRQEVVVKIAMEFLKGANINPESEYERLASTFNFEELVVDEAVRYIMDNRLNCKWRDIYRKFNLNRVAKSTVEKIEGIFRESIASNSQ